MSLLVKKDVYPLQNTEVKNTGFSHRNFYSNSKLTKE